MMRTAQTAAQAIELVPGPPAPGLAIEPAGRHALPLPAPTLAHRIATREARIGVVGLGYVGLPLALACRRSGFPVLGFDIDPEKVSSLNAGRSYIRHIRDEALAEAIRGKGLAATTELSRVSEVDAILICVPTPLTSHREPDLGYVESTARTIAPHLRTGQLVVLQSTTYPGTTRDVLRPILEQQGMRAGTDFYLAFSPEREDPGNAGYETSTIPKVVGADDAVSQELAVALYSSVINRVVPVPGSATAEAVKLTENIFRAVNIALVNELKSIYERMGIDIWDVIDGAKTKPFGFMPFYPGPGLGGHCIPIDPFYLTWKAREHGLHTRFIELAGEINTSMPDRVVSHLAEALDRRHSMGLYGTRVLMLGVAYKKNVDDMRESPALRIMDLLIDRGAVIAYHDPYVPVIVPTREHPRLAGMRSAEWTPAGLAGFDAALICTDHDGVDYEALLRHCPLVVDTRNATRGITTHRDRIVKA